MSDVVRSDSVGSEAVDSGSATRPSVAVVVPAYREAAIIAATIEAIVAELRRLAPRYRAELIVVDDGSPDGTGEIADRSAAHAAGEVPIRVLRHEQNRGLGAALATGFAAASTDYVVVLDCDLSYDVAHIARLLDRLVATRAAVVIASPYARGGTITGVPRLRLLASRGANRALGILAPGRLRTLTGMVRAYDTTFLHALDLEATGSDLNTEIVFGALTMGVRVEEVAADLVWTRSADQPRPSVGWLVRGTLRSMRAALRFRRAVARERRGSAQPSGAGTGERVVDPGA